MNSLILRFQRIISNKTVKNGSLFAIFSFFNKGISFILLTVLARFISPSDYGELSLFNTFVTLISYFVGLSTAGYLGVAYFKEDKIEFKKDVSAICLITLFATALIFICFIITSQWLSVWLKLTVPFIFFGLIISFANTFVSLNLDYCRVREKLSTYGFLSCSFTLLNFIITLYLVIKKNQNWQGQVYALLFCNVVYAIIAVFMFYRNQILSFPKTWTTYKKIIKWGLPVIPHLASGWIKQGLDRYIIDDTHSLSDVGLFSFAMNVASIIITIGIAFNQTNSVNLYQSLSSEVSSYEKRISLMRKERYFSLIYLALVILIISIGIFAIPKLMPKYSSCVLYFIILSVYGFFQCIYFLYCNYLFYFNNTKQLMYITFGSSIVHLGLSLWLTRYSLYYTCGIYVFTIIVVVFLVYIRSRKLLKENLV